MNPVALVVRNGVTTDARVLRTARTLAAQGAEVVVVGLRTEGSAAEESHDGVRIVRVTPGGRLLGALDAVRSRAAGPGRVKVLVRRVVRAPRTAAYAWAFQVAAAAEMAAARPSVYHCNDFHTVFAGILASRRHTAKIVYDAHEIYAHQHLVPRTLRRRLLVRVAEQILVRRAAAVITVNASLAAWYARTYRTRLPAVVRNVPDVPASGPPAALPEGWPEKGPVLIYVGSVTSGRGLDGAIGALTRLPDARLVLLGNVSSPKAWAPIEAKAFKSGVGDRVHALGAVPPSQVVSVASRADVGLALIEPVSLSYRLSLPNKLFEYAHAGLPVVASDLPEIAAVVNGYGLGVTCDPTDPGQIAAGVTRLLEDRTLHAACVAGARAAAERFTWEREQRALLDVYRTLWAVP